MERVELWNLAFMTVSSLVECVSAFASCAETRCGDGTSVKRGGPPCMKGGGRSAEDLGKESLLVEESGCGVAPRCSRLRFGATDPSTTNGSLVRGFCL